MLNCGQNIDAQAAAPNHPCKSPFARSLSHSQAHTHTHTYCLSACGKPAYPASWAEPMSYGEEVGEGQTNPKDKKLSIKLNGKKVDLQ